MATIINVQDPNLVAIPQNVVPNIPFLNSMAIPTPIPAQNQMAMPVQMPVVLQQQGMPVNGMPGVMPGQVPMQPPMFYPNKKNGNWNNHHHHNGGGGGNGGGGNRNGFQGKGRRRDTGELSKNNIYINCLKSSTKDEDLKSLCQSYGPIISAKAIIDRETNQCKGYGFVMFEKESSAKIAVSALVRKGAQAAFAKVTRAQVEWQGRQEADPTNLYLTNLPNDQDEAALSAMLMQCLENVKGEVVSCRILREPDGEVIVAGMSRRVGLARMDCREACEVIIKRLNGCLLPGSVDPLRVKFANSPSPRKSKYNRRDNMGRGGRHNGYQQEPFDLAFMQANGLDNAIPDMGALRLDPSAAAQNPYIPQAMVMPAYEKRQWAQADDKQRGPGQGDAQAMAMMSQHQMFERVQRQGGNDFSGGDGVNFGDVDSIFSPAAVAQANAQRRAQDKFNETIMSTAPGQPPFQMQQQRGQVPVQQQGDQYAQYDMVNAAAIPGAQFGFLA